MHPYPSADTYMPRNQEMGKCTEPDIPLYCRQLPAGVQKACEGHIHSKRLLQY